MVTTVRLGSRRTDPCFWASKTHLDVRAVACVHIRYQRRDSAAVSSTAQTQQYGSIQRNTGKVILGSVMRSQHDGRRIRPRSRRRAGTRHQRTSVTTRAPGCCRFMSCKIAVSLPLGPGTRRWTCGNGDTGGRGRTAPLSSPCLKRISAKAIKKPQPRSNVSASTQLSRTTSRVRREAP